MGVIKHRKKPGLMVCPQCGAWSSYGFGDPPKDGCARRAPNDGESMCHETRILLLQMALRRAIIPDAFDERMRIKPGRLLDVLDAENAAMRQVNSLLGPTPASFAPAPRNEGEE